MPQRPEPESLIRAQVVLDEHDMSADGRFAVVVRRFVIADRYRSHLWLVPLEGRSRPIQLTDGPVRDTGPRIAPDGAAVAFRRSAAASPGRRHRGTKVDAADEVSRLRILPLSPKGTPTGAPWAIRTPRDRSVGEVAWSPSGERLAITMDVDPPRFLVGSEPVGDDAPMARRITRIDWRWDEEGFVDRWSHLHLVDVRRGALPRQVTRGDWGVSKLAWSPDGKSVAFVADPRPDADVRPIDSIWTVAADANGAKGEPRPVLKVGGPATKPAWSPDGRWLAAYAYVAADAVDDTSPELVVGPADGSAPAWPLAPTLDRPLGTWCDTDMHGWVADSRTTPVWVDPGTIVAVVTDRGRAVPWRYAVDPETGKPKGDPSPLTTRDMTTYSFAATSNASVPWDRRISVVGCLDDRPMELMTVPLEPPAGTRTARAATEAGAPAVRTRLGSRWRDRFAWPRMQLVQAPGPGGPIETWVASPADAPDEPLPTIVDIHGGPLGAWAPAPSVEVVLLCAAGYRVVLPNIRGSTSYGRDWIRPHLGHWGEVDAEDVHAALDHAIALGLADPDRLGALGLSYGGFMVHWLMGTSDRFRAGISDGGVTNQVSGWAQSDSGVDFNRWALLGTPLDREGVDKLWRQSPLANVANVRTPLLILQGEEDKRCPPSDNEQLFVALRYLGRTVEYVLYPEESHVYFTSGRPDRRIDRMTRMLDWFDRHVRAD